MYGYIYKTINLVNGKIYIGQKHSDKFLGNEYLGSGLLLKRAIKKYGKENFNVELLEECNSKILLNEREIYWIDYYAKCSDCCYNLSKGGQGGNLGNVVNIKISNVLKNRNTWTKGRKTINNGKDEKKVSPESLATYLNDGWILGKLMTEKCKNSLRNLHEVMQNKSEESKKEILDKIAISRDIKIMNRTKEERNVIRKHISEGRKNSSNLNTWNKGKSMSEWMTKEHYQNFIKSQHEKKSEKHRKHLSETRKRLGLSKEENNPRAKKVLCIETNVVYNYSGCAATAFNTSAEEIRKCCLGRRKSIRGFTFKYVK